MTTVTESKWLVWDRISNKYAVRGNIWGLEESPNAALLFKTEARAMGYIKAFGTQYARMRDNGYPVEIRDYYTVPVEITYNVTHV